MKREDEGEVEGDEEGEEERKVGCRGGRRCRGGGRRKYNNIPLIICKNLHDCQNVTYVTKHINLH